MTSDLKFVFDTNTLVSALLLKGSVPRIAFDHAIATGQILMSLDVLVELNDVIKRDKFSRYIKEDERIQFQIALTQQAVFVEITETIEQCRDPKDDKYLELAISGNAACIVTGDQDLLVMHPFRNIPIITAAEFITAYKTGSS